MADLGTIDIDVEPTDHGIIDIDVPPAPRVAAPKAAPTDHGVVDIDVAPAPKAPAPKATYAAGRDWSDPWAATKATQRELFLAKARAKTPVTARFPLGLSVDLPRTPETERLSRPAPEIQPEQESLGRRLMKVPAGVARTIGGAFTEPVETAKGAWEGLVSTGENLGSNIFDTMNRLTDAQKAEQDEYISRREKADNPADVEREYTQKTGYHLPPFEPKNPLRGILPENLTPQRFQTRERSEPERQEFYREHGVEAEPRSMDFFESVGHTTRGLVEPLAQFADVAASERPQREKAKALAETAVQLYPPTGMPIYAAQRAAEFAASPGRALTANPAQTLLDVAAARGAVKARNEAALRKAQGKLDAKAAAERQPHLEDAAEFTKMAEESERKAAEARAAGDAQTADAHTQDATRQRGLAQESQAKADAVVTEQAVRTERQFQPDVEREAQNAEQQAAAEAEFNQREQRFADARRKAIEARNERIRAVQENNSLDMQKKRRLIAAIKLRSMSPTIEGKLRREFRQEFAQATREQGRIGTQLEALKQPESLVPDVPEMYNEALPGRPGASDLQQLRGELGAAVELMDESSKQMLGGEQKGLPKSVERRQMSVAKLRESAEQRLQNKAQRASQDADLFDRANKAQLSAIERRKTAADPKVAEERRNQLLDASRAADEKEMAQLDEFDKANAGTLSDIAQRRAAGTVRPELQKFLDALQKQNKPETAQRIQDLLERSKAADVKQEQRIAAQRAQLEKRLSPSLDRLTASTPEQRLRPEHRREWAQIAQGQKNVSFALRPEYQKSTAAKVRAQVLERSRKADAKRLAQLDEFDRTNAAELSAIEQRAQAQDPGQQVRPEFQKAWDKLQKQNKPKTQERRDKLLAKSRDMDARAKNKILGQRSKLEEKLTKPMERTTAPTEQGRLRPEHREAYAAAEDVQKQALQKSQARDAQEAAAIAARRAELEKARPPIQAAQAALTEGRSQYEAARQEGRTQAQALLEEQQRRVEDQQRRQLEASQLTDAAAGMAVTHDISAKKQAVENAKAMAISKTEAAQRNAKRLAEAKRRLEQVKASGEEIRRNRPYQDVTVYHPDFATRGKVGAAIEQGLTYLSPVDLALKALSKAASLHPATDVLFNPRNVESRRPLREAETLAKTESEQSRQRLTDVAATLPEKYRPEGYEAQRRSTEADANLTPEQKQQNLRAIDRDEKYYQRELSDLWEAAHELTNEQMLEMNPDAPKGQFFSTQVELPEVNELMRRLNEFDQESDLWREARRTSAASQASGGFGGIVQPNVEANIAARNEAVRMSRAPEGTPGKGKAEAFLRRTMPTTVDAQGNPITPSEFYEGKTRERLPAAPNLWQPNVYPEEAYLEGVYKRATEKGLGPEDTKYLGEEFPPNQPLTPAQALQFIQDKHGRRITDITPGAFQYREVPAHLGIGGKGGPSSESTGAVEGRGLAKRTMQQVSREDREAYGMSTDPRDAIAALHQENVDTADRNMWRRLSSDSNVYRTIQPNDRDNWVIFDNRKGEFGHPYGAELPEKFWVRADIAADMDLIRKVHELQAASLVQGRGSRIWGSVLDLMRGFKAAHTFLSPSGYGTNLFGNLVPQATVAGINPLNPRFIGKVVKAFLEATEGRETESQRQFALDRDATALGFINRAETNPESIRSLGEGTQGLGARLRGAPQGLKDIVTGLRTKVEGAPELQGTSWEKTRKGTPEQARAIGRMRQAFESAEQAPRKAYSAMDEIPRQAIYEYLKDVKKLDPKEAARIADNAVGQTTDLPGLMRYLSVFIPFTFSFPAAQFQAALGFMRKNPERFLLWSKVNQDLKMDATHKAEQDELMKELGRVDKDFHSMGAGLTREEQRRGQRDQPFTPMATLMPETFRGSTAAVDIGKWQPGDTYAPRGPSDTYADVAQRIISRNPFVDTAAKLIYGKDLARPYNKETMSPEHRIKAIGDSFIPMYQTIARIVASVKGEPFRGVEEAAPLGQTLLRTIGMPVQEGEAPEKLKERANISANMAVRQFRQDFRQLQRTVAKNPRADKVGDTFYSLRNKLEAARANASLGTGRTIDAFLRMLDTAEKRWRSRLDAANRPMAE